VKHTAISNAAVVDSAGRVIASVGPAEPTWVNSPDVARVPLPDGGFLAASPDGRDASWSNFARAFVHEARSPLNALVIYLELLGPRTAQAEGRASIAPEKVLAKAQEQVRRVEDLLRTFSELWAPRGELADFAAITRSAARFSEHQAIRKSLRFTQQICESAPIAAAPVLVADALVALMSGALQARPESAIDIKLELLPEDREARLTVTLPVVAGEVPAGLFETGAAAFRKLGASVLTTDTSAVVTMPMAPPPEPT